MEGREGVREGGRRRRRARSEQLELRGGATPPRPTMGSTRGPLPLLLDCARGPGRGAPALGRPPQHAVMQKEGRHSHSGLYSPPPMASLPPRAARRARPDCARTPALGGAGAGRPGQIRRDMPGAGVQGTTGSDERR